MYSLVGAQVNVGTDLQCHTLPHSPWLLSLPSHIGACMFISEATTRTMERGISYNGRGYLVVHLGYGHGRPCRISPKYEYGHRLVLYLIFGPPPPSEQAGPWECCHMCCNKSCLNPFHLVWGTRRHNLANAMATYINLAREQGHPEDTIPKERPQRVF